MARWSLKMAWIWAALSAASCAGQQSTIAATDPILAGVTVAVAAAAQGAVGCRFQGCPYGSYCDRESGLCVARKCGEGCPDGTICNEGLDRCQAPPPPQVPNDYIPTDREIDRFPTVH